MAELRDRLDITVEELEESLGQTKLPRFINESERLFLDRIDAICDEICSDPGKRAIFVSGPTSSGKTTFTLRLSEALTAHGRKGYHLSLDDYYSLKELTFDRDGRPDFETIDTLDTDRIVKDINAILAGERVVPPFFDFTVRQQREGDPANYGNVYCDSKLMDSTEIRLLRRIVRDYRHRSAHALATIDYWPMITKSEEKYYTDYLTRADYHINSFLAYESLIIAPMALHDISEAMEQAMKGTIAPSVFMEKSATGKPFADLSAALNKAAKLQSHLNKIPVVDPAQVPAESILNEFIGA